MKDVIKFCKRTVAETKPAIQNIEAKLKASIEREEFSEIDQTINEESTSPKKIHNI